MTLYVERNGILRFILILMQHNLWIIASLILSSIHGNHYNLGFGKENFSHIKKSGIYLPQKAAISSSLPAEIKKLKMSFHSIKNSEKPFNSMLINPPLINFKIHPKTLHLFTRYHQNHSCCDITPRGVEEQIAKLLREGKYAKATEQRVTIPLYNSKIKKEICIPSISQLENKINQLIHTYPFSVGWRDIYGVSLLFLACENNMLSFIPKFLQMAEDQDIPICYYAHQGQLPIDILNKKLQQLNTNADADKKELIQYQQAIKHLTEAQNNTRLFKQIDKKLLRKKDLFISIKNSTQTNHPFI